MQDIAGKFPQAFMTPSRGTFHHGNVPEALLRAARQLLDAGDTEEVGLREVARRVGVSAAAAYKHFVDKDDLMATVATEGFRELAAELWAAADEPDPAIAVGLVYVEFARTRQGLFRLMFGPLLALGEKYPALRKAAEEAFEAVERRASRARSRESAKMRRRKRPWAPSTACRGC